MNVCEAFTQWEGFAAVDPASSQNHAAPNGSVAQTGMLQLTLRMDQVLLT
jgi:hypothetical protein